jgi:hypothetical protein
MKLITLILCYVGVVMIAVGMSRENNPLFIIGIISVGVGYIIIRRRLKESLREPEDTNHDG